MTSRSIAQLLDLSGQAAAVTGPGKRIGRAIALRLVEAGAAMLLADREQGAAQLLASQIADQGGRAAAAAADVSRVSNVRALVRQTAQTFGRLDILVNNAGIFPLCRGPGAEFCSTSRSRRSPWPEPPRSSRRHARR